jgi:hypothetical protein
MIHPQTQLKFINSKIGYGIVATQPIPRGTILWVGDKLDQKLTATQVREMGEPYTGLLDKYCYLNRHGQYILCWDLARYVNHSCAPTMRPAGYDFEIAVRDLVPGDELTDDYGSLNLLCDFRCLCGKPTCRGRIGVGDLERLGPMWDLEVAEAFKLIERVPQPLWDLVQEKHEVHEVLTGRVAMASCLEHLYSSRGAPGHMHTQVLAE